MIECVASAGSTTKDNPMRFANQSSSCVIDEPATQAPGVSARAVVLVGHGSVRAGAGAAMIRLAERLRAARLAPIVGAGFLNYRRPTFAESLARCVAEGATEVVVQPYFLVPGKYVRDDVERLVVAGRQAHPGVELTVARPFGDHPALAALLLKRALEADYLAAHPHIRHLGQPRALGDGAGWQPLHRLHRTGLLILAHGSPDRKSNASIYGIARRVRATGRYAAVSVCFLGLNKPSIPTAIDQLIARGIRHIVAAPYFLHLGSHVAEDLPLVIGAGRARNPHATILLAEHLAYDRLLLTVIADRVAEATLC
jgi:sirohydrochlorin ferrochelatase